MTIVKYQSTKDNQKDLSWESLKEKESVIKMDHLNQYKFKHPLQDCLYNIYWNHTDYELSVVAFKNAHTVMSNIIKYDIADHNLLWLNYKNNSEQLLVEIVADHDTDDIYLKLLKGPNNTAADLKITYIA
jgi:hypothetical protein